MWRCGVLLAVGLGVEALVTSASAVSPWEGAPRNPGRHSLSAQEVDVWSRPIQAERDRSFDFLHYRVALTFDLDARAFRGENRITLTPLSGGVDRVELDAEEIVIEGVRGGQGEDLSFFQGDTSLVVTLSRPLALGDTAELVVAYRLTRRS